MKYRKLGSSGIKVSSVSLGGWLTFGGTVEDSTAQATVHRAIEGGVNYIDLADVYNNGKAERLFGKVLPELNRDNLIVSSKCYFPMSNDPNDRGLSRKHIMQSVERSLRNLGTDYIDFYFCHREDDETALEETAMAMSDLVRQGKILYWGTSVWSAATLEATHQITERCHLHAPRVEQPEYSLLERSVEKEVLPAAKRLGMGVVVWSPLAGGVLTGKYNDGIPPGSRAKTTEWLDGKLTEDRLERVRAFCEIAAKLEARPEQLALAWILKHPEITSVIFGASTPEQVDHNLAAAKLEIPNEAMLVIDALFPAE